MISLNSNLKETDFICENCAKKFSNLKEESKAQPEYTNSSTTSESESTNEPSPDDFEEEVDSKISVSNLNQSLEPLGISPYRPGR
jgi:hypothetical protein